VSLAARQAGASLAALVQLVSLGFRASQNLCSCAEGTPAPRFGANSFIAQKRQRAAALLRDGPWPVTNA